MQIDSQVLKTGMLLALITGSAHSAPIEGAMRSNLAALLLVLGVGALLMGVRNLRELRHKRLGLGRHTPNAGERYLKPGDSSTGD